VLALLALNVLGIQAACTDGVDNLIAVTDCSSGSPLSIQSTNLMTYLSNGSPSCDPSGGGLVNFPGEIKLKSISGTISKPMHFEGDTRLKLTFKKNTFPAVVLCQDGKSQFPGIPDDWCNFDLCTIVGLEQFCQQLDDKTGPFTLAVDTTITLPAVPDFLAPVINGNFLVSGSLTNTTTSEVVACIHNDKVNVHGG